MAIANTDILFKYSLISGSAGNAAAQPDANASLGKYVSTTEVTSSAFDKVTGAENAASTVDYRGIFVHNNHATLTAENVVVYLSAETAGGTTVAIAIDDIAASAKGASSAQMALIASETTAPSGVGAFSSPTTSGTGLSIGNLTAGQVRGFWVKRTAANTGPVDADGVTLAAYFDTPA